MATVYVNNNPTAQTSPAYDDQALLGSIANPYPSPKAAEAGLAGVGGTALIRGGSQNDNEPYRPVHSGANVITTCHDIGISGTQSDWVSFEAYDPDNEPVQFNGVDPDGLRHNGCIEINGHSYVAYRNIECTDANQRIVRARNGNFITLYGIEAHKNYIGNIAAIHVGGLVQNATIEACETYDAGRGILLSGSIIAGQQNDPDNQVRYCTVRNCYSHDNVRDEDDSDGMQAAGAPDCVWIDCVSANNADDGMDFFGGSHRNTARRCISIGHTGSGEGEGRGFVAGVWGQAPQGDDIGGAADCSYEWCVAVGNKFNFYSSGVRVSFTNCTGANALLNNMTVDESAGNAAQTTIKHCLFWGSVGDDILMSTGKPNPIAYCDYNAYSDTTSANDHPDESGHDANSVFSVADPFVDSSDIAINTSAVLDGAVPDIAGIHLTAGNSLLTGGENDSQIGAFGAPIQDEVMASYQFNHNIRLFYAGTVSSGSTVKAMLMDADYVPDRSIKAIDTGANDTSDPSSHELVATNYQGGHAGTGRKTVTLSFTDDDSGNRSVAVISNQTWASLGGVADDDISGVLIFAESTSDANSWPLYFIDSPTVTTNGSNVNVTFDQTATIAIG